MERVLGGVDARLYRHALNGALSHALGGGGGDAGVAGAGSAWLYSNAKSELAPMEDRGVIFMPIARPTAPRWSTPRATCDAIERITAGNTRI